MNYNRSDLDTINLTGVIPDVFRDRRGSVEIAASSVWDSSLTFHRGAVYVVEAASGTGKSSLCSFLYGVRRDYTGVIDFDGDDIASFSIPRWSGIRRDSLAYLPQELELFDELTVIDNILVKNNLTGFKTADEIRRMLDEVGLAGYEGRLASTLSVGQRQRVAIVRALCQPFSFILLDEPVSHLDTSNNTVVAGLIQAEAARQGAGIIATSVGNPLALDNPVNIRL